MSRVSLDVRQIGGSAVVVIGLFSLLTAALINPAVGRLLKEAQAIDYADVLASYFAWSLGVGLGLIALGVRIARGPSRLDSVAVLIVALSALVLADRFLLTRFNLTIWTYDSDLWYRHRPNAVRTLAGVGRPESLVVINRWGYHDTDLPLEKPAGQLRAVAIGDSTTMGYGLVYEETYSAHLEALLRRHDRRHASHEIVNAGVHGYTTYQQKVALERALAFSPDLIIVGFCLNDVTEPFVVDKKFGGTGLDYHQVVQAANPVSGWLANETGFGRAAQTFANRGKNREAEKRLEVYNVRRMAEESGTSPKMKEAWRIVLDQLGEIYQLAARRKLPVVLVVFPYTFQLADPALRAPQRILAEHAARHGVPVIDTTDDFARAVFDDPGLVQYLRARGKSGDEILAYHRFRVDEYFFDENHFTSAGNRIVARRLFDHLVQAGMVNAREISAAVGSAPR